MKKKVAYMGVLLALALICSFVESLIPFTVFIGIPGIKLGLANLVTVVALYCIGTWEALVISVLRIVLSGFMFGSAFGILYSLAGGLLSFLVMWLFMRFVKLHCLSVSTAGGISHNIGQLIVAAFVVETYSILYYIPVLIAAGALTGFLIGIIAQEISLRIGDRLSFGSMQE